MFTGEFRRAGPHKDARAARPTACVLPVHSEKSNEPNGEKVKKPDKR
jgi:hypothetical protein